MITKESLQERYAQTETTDLLEIACNKNDYTELAVSVALKELKKRDVPNDLIKGYQPVLTRKMDEQTKTNCVIDLKFWQKLLFYVIWIPRIRRLFTTTFHPGGYLLKSTQSNYYSVTGFVVFMFSAIVGQQYTMTDFFFYWVLGFLLVFLFDVAFNRERQLKQLHKIIEQGEIPWGYF